VKRIVDSVVTSQLGEWLEQHPPALAAIVAKGLMAARAAEAARKARELVRRKNVLTRSTLPGKLADCTSNDRWGGGVGWKSRGKDEEAGVECVCGVLNQQPGKLLH
jgi:hypothetical protein